MSLGFPDKRPRYQIVAETLFDEIRRGAFPVGSHLPTEAQICERFAVSRHTVREALRSLANVGVVASQHGIGTQVTSDHIQERYVQSFASISDLWQYVKDTRRETIALADVIAADARIALPGDPGASWRMLEGLRYVAGSAEPVAWTQVFLLPRFADVFDEIRDEVLIYALIERRHGILTRKVRQTITATTIDAPTAALLKVEPGSCGLSVLREYVGEGDEPYEVTWSVHPAGRYSYSMEVVLAQAPP
jgi:DNA-binding GntR family transcriptional regulator